MRPLLTALCLVSTPLAAQDAPQVVTDIAPVRALVAQLMEGVGTPDQIIPAGSSPHSYAMRPSEARALRNADLVVWVGPALTHWLEEPLDTLAPDAARLTLMAQTGTQVLPMREAEGLEQGHAHEDHANGTDHEDHKGHDDHEDHADHDAQEDGAHAEEAHDDAGHAGHDHQGDTDPHGWLSPVNAVVWAEAIAAELTEIDPENAAIYTQNLTTLRTEVVGAVEDITALLAPLKDKPFIVLHDGSHYFEESFGITAKAFIVSGDGSTPGPARLKALRDHLTQQQIVCAFTDPQENAALVDTVTEGQNTRVVALDPLGDGQASYAVWLRKFADDMAGCLKGD